MNRIIALVLVFFLTAFTKTLYVNGSTGSDATTYANNNINNPWLTIGRAAWGNATRPSSVDDNSPPTSSEAAQAGDTVMVASGTYYTTQGSSSPANWDEVVYNSANEGTYSNPIVFYADGQVILQTELSNGGQPVFGSRLRDYVEWNGFTAYESGCTLKEVESGLAVLVGVFGSKIVGGYLQRDYESNGTGNNVNCIYFHSCDSSSIIGVTLNGATGNGGENQAGVTCYNLNDCVIEYNEFYDGNAGLYIKAPFPSGEVFQTNLIIRYNLFHDNSYGFRLLTAGPAHGYYSKIYQNVFWDNATTFQLTPITDEARDFDSLRVVNNTFYAGTGDHGIHIAGGSLFDDVYFYNNIVAYSPDAYWSYSNDGNNATFQTEFNPDYNCYYSISGNFFNNEGDVFNYTEWQAIWGDANSVTSDPQFRNTTVDSFQTDATLNGLDILDLDNDSQTNDAIQMGAYITGNETFGPDGYSGGGEGPGGLGSGLAKGAGATVIKGSGEGVIK
ncbi:MAG: hypothetical protein A2Y94_13875 [Caldithrix sp. RBG_13_44_9]|nr:MAG: hypothetical protein A2Y94_13875 [Caldithrix sp. RBG_13_44_9]